MWLCLLLIDEKSLAALVVLNMKRNMAVFNIGGFPQAASKLSTNLYKEQPIKQ